MKQSLTAQKLRIILFVVMLAIVAGTAGGFMYAKSGLDEYANAISQLNADALSGDSNIQTLRGLKSTLDSEEETIRQAQSVVATSTDYADKVISNITDIASSSGVTVTSIEFVDNTTTSTTGQAQSTTGTAPAANSGSAPGVTKKSISVSIKTPLDYSTLLKFLGALESNDLKMQLTSLNLTKGSDDKIETQAFIIEVYVRS